MTTLWPSPEILAFHVLKLMILLFFFSFFFILNIFRWLMTWGLDLTETFASPPEAFCYSLSLLTLPVLRISESCIEIKINLNFKVKIIFTTKKCENKNFNFFSSSRIGREKAKVMLKELRLRDFSIKADLFLWKIYNFRLGRFFNQWKYPFFYGKWNSQLKTYPCNHITLHVFKFTL